MLTCPECGGTVVYEGGEHVCTECGLVVGDGIATTEKYVSFTSVDHHEKITSVMDNPLRKRGNKVHTKTPEEKRDDTVHHLLENCRAPDYIRSTAKMLAGKYFRAGGDIRKIGSNEDFVAALLYLSYRLCKQVPPSELGDAEKVQTRVSKIVRVLRSVGANVPIYSVSPGAHELIPVLCRKLGRPELADNALKLLASLPHSSQMPATRAAVCVYEAFHREGVKVTFKEVAKAAGINSSTVSKSYNEVFKSNKEKKDIGQDTQIPVRGIAASEFLTVLHHTLLRLSNIKQGG